MADLYRLKVLTLEKSVYDADVRSLVAPGLEGYFGVLAHHAPFVAALQPGKLTVTDAQGVESIYAVSGGLMEVSGNAATLLADAIEQACDIDLARAEAARERAFSIVCSVHAGPDAAGAKAAFARATNRIQVCRSRRPE
ncbi:MAG: ATP synthase F1 subunit epsilon [Candidatus Eisenbacteria bacterium]|nr:ATP synthase F1 subunit epsilon [Candidatus Eisenbacteria bacterium]